MNWFSYILAKCVFILFLFAGCSEDCTKGELRLTNTSSNPYDIWINGESKGTLAGGTFQNFEVNEGTHELRCKQVSGFVLFPTEKSTSIGVPGCGEREWIFP